MLAEAQASITITITCEPWTKAESQMRRAGCNTLCNLSAHSGRAALCHLCPVGLFECEITCWRIHFRAFPQLKSLNYLDMGSYPQPRATLRTVGGEFTRQSEEKKKDHYIYFSAGRHPQIVSLFLQLWWSQTSGTWLLFPSSSPPPLYVKKKKRKDLFSQRWKDEVRPGILQRARCVMCCLKRMHTDHFKDIWRPNGRWRCVAMAATCCTVLRSSSEATAAWKIIWYNKKAKVDPILDWETDGQIMVYYLSRWRCQLSRCHLNKWIKRNVQAGVFF